jgi:iron complex outermembrane receptor protein
VTHAGLDSTGAQNQFTENIGRSVNKGVEVEAQILATENTLLRVNVQYLDASYDSYLYQVPLGAAPPYTSCAVSLNAANPLLRNVDCSGKPAYQAPKWTANFAVQQTFPVGAYKVVVKADTQYKSERFIGSDFLPHQRVGDTWISNAEVALSPQHAPWTVGVYVRNIEDDRVPVSGGVFSVGGVATVITSPPRTYGLTVSARF